MRSLRSLPSREAGFVEPMECLAVTKLPDGPGWVFEIKLDGYRALATNTDGKLSLYSRRRKSFSRQYQHVFEALRDLPPNTVVDGKIVALDDAISTSSNIHAAKRNASVISCLICRPTTIAISPNPRECCALGSAEGRAGDAGGFLIHLMLFPAT